MFTRFFKFFTFIVLPSLILLTLKSTVNQTSQEPASQEPTSQTPDSRTPASFPSSGVPVPGPFFRPNFNTAPQMLPQGTQIIPLCNHINPLVCINQWGYQALPLSYQQPGILPQYQFYLPSFVPSRIVAENPAESEDWEMFTLPLILDTEESDYSRTFYRNKSNHDHVRVVQKNENGEKQILDGRVKLISENDIENTAGNFVITKNTEALPATVKEVKPGCFVIEKTKANTEAGFIYNCRECLSQQEDSVLSVLAEDPHFMEALDEKHREVARSAAHKVANQTSGSGDTITKICSAEQSLSAIILNFNNTCPGNFDTFFKKAYCRSCKKGIPPEIMLAMMSIESGGRCGLPPGTIGRSGESSIGILQIESNSHQCDTNTIGSSKNRECLRDPINNLNKSIEILFDHYGKVNPQSPVTPQSSDTFQCSSWLNSDSKQKDAWRRGVSAYNGGPGWVTRAMESASNTKTLTDTSYLVGKHNKASAYKNDTVDWEKLRAYYFIERLSPGNRIGTGRNDKKEQANGYTLDLTVSNIAHTEAVLGRNVATTAPGMVEIWAKYISKNKPSTCTQ